MSWLLERVRINREQSHHRKVRKLHRKQWKRIHAIEQKYEAMNFFASPEAIDDEMETGIIPDAREKYLLYLLQRVGIYFIPNEAIILARKFGPTLATERVCRWLGLDYHKIAAVAPRVATETARATMYFKEMQHSCDVVGINANALLPHIHFGSHDTRDVLFENFRLSARIIQIYDALDDSFKEPVNWEEKRPIFIDEWKDITTDCLMNFYHQGLLLTEYYKILDRGNSILISISQSDPELFERWLDEDTAPQWREPFPSLEMIIIQVHLLNRVREINYRCSREWNRLLKKMEDTDFDFRILHSEEVRME
ncbi:MAG: hypothetical protein P1U89_09205 [Verrucomicrobiales bacterium]|nr:hypothetical protein [Verrucomicrobiales bacterium]